MAPLTFAGVDLAARPAGTAVAVLAVADGVRLAHVVAPADDDAILEATAGCAKVGLDCPLGWPEAFADFVAAHRRREQRPVTGDPARWLDQRTYRVTDLRLRADTTGPLARIMPMSAAADRLGRTALRCGSLQALMSQRWGAAAAARDGSGRIVEVYPAASLAVWGLAHTRYKGPSGAAVRDGIRAALLERAGISCAPDARASLGGDHAVDALIAALAAADAWAAGWHATHPAARAEGWIHVPAPDLAGLAGRVRARAATRAGGR